MLRDAFREIKKNYYDPKFHGIDLDSRFHEYDAKLNSITSVGDSFRIISGFLSGFHDSHLYFQPPSRRSRFDPGYRMAVIGDKCLVLHVRPGSDAAAKLHPGDRILKFNGFEVNRGDLKDIEYYFHVLAPGVQDALEMEAPDGSHRSEIIKTIVIPTKAVMDLTTEDSNDFWDMVRRDDNEDHLYREQIAEQGGVAVWKMSRFEFEADSVDRIFARIKKDSALILDLRGNPGGYTDSLQWLVGHLFDHDVKIADRETRKPEKPMVAKHNGTSFAGKVVVLVDSRSESASELLARVIQLEHRGVVLGDVTAGSVMEARQYQESQGADVKVFYGFSVTCANLMMSDGTSLEGVGVTPSAILLPKPKDIAEGKDPVLSQAASLLGVTLDPVAAGKLFPYEWRKL